MGPVCRGPADLSVTVETWQILPLPSDSLILFFLRGMEVMRTACEVTFAYGVRLTHVDQ